MNVNQAAAACVTLADHHPAQTQPVRTETIRYVINLRRFDSVQAVDTEVNSLLGRLDKIKKDHLEWKDPLSIQLRDWIVGFIYFFPNKNDRDEKRIHQMIRKIDYLIRQILVDPLHSAPLKEPVLERHYVWERKVLENYKKYSQNSPFDRQKMNAPETHLFAVSMLNWLKLLPIESHNPHANLVLDECKDNEKIDDNADRVLALYHDKARVALVRHNVRRAYLARKLVIYTQAAKRLYDDISIKTADHNAQLEAQAKRQAQANEQLKKETIQCINAHNEELLKPLEQGLQEIERGIQNQGQQLANLDIIIHSHNNAANQLEGQLKEAKSERYNLQEDLRGCVLM